MAKSMNKQLLMGHLGADPEFAALPSGGRVATLRLITNEYWTDKATGEQRERAQGHRLKCFGPMADIVEKLNYKKGDRIYVEGSFRSEPYTDKDGIERYSAETVVRELWDVRGKKLGETASEYEHGGAPAMGEDEFSYHH